MVVEGLHGTDGSIDAEIVENARVVADLLGLEALLVNEDGYEGVPYGLRRPREDFRWRWDRRVGAQDEKLTFLDSDCRELC